jgi:hypothetical protein
MHDEEKMHKKQISEINMATSTRTTLNVRAESGAVPESSDVSQPFLE